MTQLKKWHLGDKKRIYTLSLVESNSSLLLMKSCLIEIDVEDDYI